MNSMVISLALVLVMMLITGPISSGAIILVNASPAASEGGADSSAPESEPEATEPEPESEPTPSEEEEAAGLTPEEEEEKQEAVTSQDDLPLCDGTAQDCITNAGNICKEGQGGHECECADDMSDCPNHPSLVQQQQQEGNTSVPLSLPLSPSLEPSVPNPDFAPDGDCLFNTQLPKCAPGEGQECPTDFNMNEDGHCFPQHNGCPENYHGHEDDESGECISNDIPCQAGYEMNEAGTNCDKENFTCDGKPSVVKCDDDNDDNNNNDNNKDHDKKVIIVKKVIKNIDIIHKIDNANSDGDLDVSETIVAINYDEGAGINCVFDDDDNGQCETFDVNKDSGKEPLLQIIDFD